jgi:hypothetical protein
MIGNRKLLGGPESGDGNNLEKQGLPASGAAPKTRAPLDSFVRGIKKRCVLWGVACSGGAVPSIRNGQEGREVVGELRTASSRGVHRR